MDLRNEKIRKMIEDDIARCGRSTVEDSEGIYNAMIARYSSLDPNFNNSLPKYAKISKPIMNYLSELDAIVAKLEMWLILGEIAPKIDFEKAPLPQSNKVFIVHGHDNYFKLEVARFIEKLKLEAIILHEQASSGQTIIEKIESYSDVSFSIVLYSGCDFGRSKNSPDEERPRARQNVVFEHGYMLAKLGRERVCAIKKSDVETPGDISGVVYIDYDNEWKIKLANELKNAGFVIDMSRMR